MTDRTIPQTGLFRQVSGNHSPEVCSICLDPDATLSQAINNVRLACACAFHYSCLVMYIKAELGDKEAVRRSDGILCPNAKQTVGTCKYGKYL